MKRRSGERGQEAEAARRKRSSKADAAAKRRKQASGSQLRRARRGCGGPRDQDQGRRGRRAAAARRARRAEDDARAPPRQLRAADGAFNRVLENAERHRPVITRARCCRPGNTTCAGDARSLARLSGIVLAHTGWPFEWKGTPTVREACAINAYGRAGSCAVISCSRAGCGGDQGAGDSARRCGRGQ